MFILLSKGHLILSCIWIIPELILQYRIDRTADCIKAHIDLPIGKSQYCKIISCKKRLTLSIFLFVFRKTMLKTVQFYNKFGFCTIKINDIVSKNLLAFESNRMRTQEIIP